MSEKLIIYIVLGISLLLGFWIYKLEERLKKLTRGNKYESIEKTLGSIEEDLQKFGVFKKDIEEYLKNVEKRLGRSIQGVHIESFNAFNGLDSGGQSFATALLNENGDGVIISTLHSRDRVNIFSKQIKNFKSDTKLTEEEELALTKARKSCNF
ncbi:MAG: hypothetical protein ACI9GH_000571 [Candidatus Paceibacteria bacterium]|jgi:hypothetical protein